MAEYLIDYENTYIEGLDGLENLGEGDEVCIFYTQNRCGLTFDLHKRLISSAANIKLLEVSSAPPKNSYSKQSAVNSVKNALDLQLTLYLGYLTATLPAENNKIYIISKDKDFGLDVEFSKQYLINTNATVERYSTIQNAIDGLTDEECERLAALAEEQEKAESENYEDADDENEIQGNDIQNEDNLEEFQSPEISDEYSPTLFNAVYNLLDQRLDTADELDIGKICSMIKSSNDLLALNNNLAALFRDGEKVKEIYHIIKPQFEMLKNF